MPPHSDTFFCDRTVDRPIQEKSKYIKCLLANWILVKANESMAHPSSEGNELESVKIARRALEESTTFGWLDSDHFAKILGVEASFLMFILA
jgi:hypothetical protein